MEIIVRGTREQPPQPQTGKWDLTRPGGVDRQRDKIKEV